MTEDWANNNLGTIELSGNLAAVGQRHLAIQNQIQQVAALQSLAEAQRRQEIEAALLQERQNILYDISAVLQDITVQLKRDPMMAFFNLLVLEEFVSSLGLDHRMFPGLEWKKHCDTTLAGLANLQSVCTLALNPEQIKIVKDALAKKHFEESQAADQLRLQQQLAQQATHAAAARKQQQRNKKSCLVCFELAVIFGLFGLYALREALFN